MASADAGVMAAVRRRERQEVSGLLEEPARESRAKGELLRERGRGKGANRKAAVTRSVEIPLLSK